jgi:hypothetical protein
MYRPKNRVAKYYVGTANAKPMFNEGALLMGKTTASTNHNGTHTASVAERFGEELRAACSSKSLDREAFIAKARKAFRKLNDATLARWYDGERLPRRAMRSWFSEEFGIEIPGSRTGEVKVRSQAEGKPAPSADLMAYAAGSLQTAIQSSDDEIIHDVKDSLKDPVQNPWMRIAVTLIRNAHRP